MVPVSNDTLARCKEEMATRHNIQSQSVRAALAIVVIRAANSFLIVHRLREKRVSHGLVTK